MSARLELYALPGLPLVKPGDDLARLILDALRANGEALRARDIVVVAQKIVSKSENRYVDMSSITPGERARELAAVTGKDARFVELVLSESSDVVRTGKNVLIVRHRNGYVYANAGIDQSNIEPVAGRALLLPEDPDASAARLRDALCAASGVEVAVIINDSAGRPWRMGVTGIAIGCAGILALKSRIGEGDLFGKPLLVTEIAVADELAAAASHVMGQADEATPVVLVRGAQYEASGTGSKSLIRPRSLDLFS
jgi:coenzyme F420-0:L-glutamate ligase/coenzyme F420-1:gamma-L-glutamate ligase